MRIFYPYESFCGRSSEISGSVEFSEVAKFMRAVLFLLQPFYNFHYTIIAPSFFSETGEIVMDKSTDSKQKTVSCSADRVQIDHLVTRRNVEPIVTVYLACFPLSRSFWPQRISVHCPIGFWKSAINLFQIFNSFSVRSENGLKLLVEISINIFLSLVEDLGNIFVVSNSLNCNFTCCMAMVYESWADLSR